MQTGADADDVDDGIEGTDFMEVDGVRGGAVDVCFGLCQPGKDCAGALLDLRR